MVLWVKQQYIPRSGTAMAASGNRSNKMAVHNKGLWPYKVVPGDVISNGKTMRVVRHASQDPDSGYTTHVSMAIRKCSWTGRSTTTINYVDLKQRGFKPIGVKVSLDAQIDILLKHDATGMSRLLSCCDVKGLP